MIKQRDKRRHFQPSYEDFLFFLKKTTDLNLLNAALCLLYFTSPVVGLILSAALIGEPTGHQVLPTTISNFEKLSLKMY